MKKLLLKACCALLIVCCYANPLFAQKNKKNADFTGVWEIQQKAQISDNELIIMRFVKIFYEDGSFTNLNLNPKTSAISHKGKFLIKGDLYEESIGAQDREYLKTSLDKSQKFRYYFSEDKKTLTLEGSLKGKQGQDIPLKETWTRIEGKSS